MATSSSIIRVSIIGDAKQLQSTLNKTQGTLKSTFLGIGGAFLAAGAISKGFDVVGSALDKADAFGDALSRIKGTISPEFADRVHDIAFDFSDVGLSADEVGTLAANFADLATAAGATQPVISAALPDLLSLAPALAALHGKTVDEVVTDLGKAVKGSQKPVEEYGIVVDSALNPDAQIVAIFDQLTTKIPDAKAVLDDFHGSQDTLEAKWDNFAVKLGEHLEGPMKGAVDWLTDMADGIGPAMDGWGMLGDRIQDVANQIRDALRDAAAVAQNFLGLLGDIAGVNGSNQFRVSPGRAPRTGPGGGSTDRAISDAQRRQQERNGLGT